MKWLTLSIFILFFINGSIFSQEVTYSSLIKQSLESLSVKLQIKEREKNYFVTQLIIDQIELNFIDFPAKVFSIYFNESFSQSSPELSSAYKEYLRINRQFVNYFNGNKDFEKAQNLPTNSPENIKYRNDQLAVVRSRFFQSDSVYKDVFLKNNQNVTNYKKLVLKKLFSDYRQKNENFPLSILELDAVINSMSVGNARLYSLNQEIEVIKNLYNSLNLTHLNNLVDPKNYSKKIVDSLINIRETQKIKVKSLPEKIESLVGRLDKLIADQNETIFDKYISMRISDSASISVYSYPAAKADDFINSADSLKRLRLEFEENASILTKLLNSDNDYNKLRIKALNREISGEEFSKESAMIINKRFRYDQTYINVRRAYERSLFKSNLAILRYLRKTSIQNGFPLDYRIIPGNELQQIKNLPEVYIIENELNNLRNIIRTSWYKYYTESYSIPYIRANRNELFY